MDDLSREDNCPGMASGLDDSLSMGDLKSSRFIAADHAEKLIPARTTKPVLADRLHRRTVWQPRRICFPAKV
jgi:hypothetical protein